jgi:hypothetical protein
VSPTDRQEYGVSTEPGFPVKKAGFCTYVCYRLLAQHRFRDEGRRSRDFFRILPAQSRFRQGARLCEFTTLYISFRHVITGMNAHLRMMQSTRHWTVATMPGSLSPTVTHFLALPEYSRDLNPKSATFRLIVHLPRAHWRSLSL